MEEHAEFHAPGDVASTIAAIHQVWPTVEDSGPGTLSVNLGSPLTYRLLGFLTPTQDRPVRIQIAVRPDGTGSTVALSATGREGWYLFKPGFSERMLADGARLHMQGLHSRLAG